MSIEVKIGSTRFVPLKELLTLIRNSKLTGKLNIRGSNRGSTIYFINGLPVHHDGDEEFSEGVYQGRLEAEARFEHVETEEIYRKIQKTMESIITSTPVELIDRGKLANLLAKKPGIYITKAGGNIIIAYGHEAVYICKKGEKAKVKSFNDALREAEGKITILRGEWSIIRKIVKQAQGKPTSPLPTLSNKI